MKLWRERAGGGVLWLEGVLLPWYLRPLSSQDAKILHSEGSLHLLTSVWSKKHYWDKYLKGREMSVSGRQMEWRETNLIWMTAQEQMGRKLSLNKCDWKWEKGFQQELWNSLWVRTDVKNPFLLLILTWSRKGRKGKNWLLETAGDWDAISQGVPSSLCSYFPMFLKLLLSHLLELAILMKSSLIQNAAEHTLPAWFDSSWFAWHSAGYTLYLRG